MKRNYYGTDGASHHSDGRERSALFAYDDEDDGDDWNDIDGDDDDWDDDDDDDD